MAQIKKNKKLSVSDFIPKGNKKHKINTTKNNKNITNKSKQKNGPNNKPKNKISNVSGVNPYLKDAHEKRMATIKNELQNKSNTSNKKANSNLKKEYSGTQNKNGQKTINRTAKSSKHKYKSDNSSNIKRNTKRNTKRNAKINAKSNNKSNIKINTKTKYTKPKSISFANHKKLIKKLGIIFVTIGILFGIITYIRVHYRVDNVYVDGNTWYSDSEIIDMVMDGRFSHNSLYLSFKYRDKSIEDIPFIEKITVNIEKADTIRITVLEKAIAGCAPYLDKYLFFDRDGIIVEISDETLDGVPVVKGLDFESVVMYETLPVENTDVFDEILDITQLLAKYNLDADSIYFDSNYNLYIYFGDIEVYIGTDENIDEKVIQLPYILPSLEGKKGILHLEEYDENTETIRFEESS